MGTNLHNYIMFDKLETTLESSPHFKYKSMFPSYRLVQFVTLCMHGVVV